MADPKLDSADSSKSASLYYLLKVAEKNKIGTQADYFDTDDVGMIQSAALMQDIDLREFKEATPIPNTEWVDFLKTGQKIYAGSRGYAGFTITWTVSASDRQTEINAATAYIAAQDLEIVGPTSGRGSNPQGIYKVGIKRWALLRADWLKASDAFDQRKSKDFFERVEKTKTEKSYISKGGGTSTKFVRIDEKNILEQINKIYGPTTDIQEDILFERGMASFKNLYDKDEYVISNMSMTLGPIFSEPIWGELKKVTKMPHTMSGVIQNYIAISGLSGQIQSPTVSFTGLTDTPSSYTGGMFVRVNPQATGLELVNITGEISSEDIAWKVYNAKENLPTASSKHGMLAHVHGEGAIYMAHAGNWVKIYPTETIGSFTGLSDTPGNFIANKYLRVNSDGTGIEYADVEAGASSFTSLSETPGNFVANKYLKVTSDGTGVEYSDIDFPDSKTTFTGLTDTPDPSELNENDFLIVDGQKKIRVTGDISKLVTFTGLSDTPDTIANAQYVVGGVGGLSFSSAAPNPGGTAPSFSNISETPINYVGEQGKLLRVNSSQNGIEFFVLDQVTSITGLSDTPTGISGNYVLVGDGNQFIYKPYVTTFTGLSDTPDSYGSTGYALRISSSNEIEFYNPTFSGLSDTDNAASLIKLTGLSDVKHSTFAPNKYLQVTGTHPNYKFVYTGIHFTGLEGVPTDWSNTNTGKYLALNAAGNSIVFVNAPDGGGGGAPAFLGLSDVDPSSFADQSQKIVIVNSDANAITFTGLSDLFSGNFSGLYDTPAGYENGQYLKGTTTGLSWYDLDSVINGISGATGHLHNRLYLTGLRDTPSSIENSKYLATNGAGQIVWADGTDGGGAAPSFSGLSDTPSNFHFTEVEGQFVVASGDGVAFKLPGVSDLTGIAADADLNKFLTYDGTYISGRDFSFSNLTQTPGSIPNNKFLRSTTDGTGLEFVDISFPESTNVSGFTGLHDTPVGYSAGEFLKVNDDGNAINYGLPTFTGLSDTPQALQPNAYLKVNSLGNGFTWGTGLSGSGYAQTITGSTHFTGLMDTPNTITNGSLLIGKGGFLNFVKPSDLSIKLSDLTDTPPVYGQSQNGKYLKVTPDGTRIEYAADIDIPDGTFAGLTDTPGSFGSAGQFLKVNAGGTALEFTDAPAGGGGGDASSAKGGLGSQTGIQAMSNFHTNLPDYIQYVRNDGVTGIGNLYLFDSTRFQYASHHATANYYIDFNNDAEGTYKSDEGINQDVFGANLSLSGYIAKGKAYYVGGGENGAAGSSILPSGSILQKVHKSPPTANDVAGVGTELCSLDITPKASDSILICNWTATTWEDNNSVQQGRFYKDGVGFGDVWYSNIAGVGNRVTVGLRSEVDAVDTDTKTISVKINLDNSSKADYSAQYLTIEEIAKSDYELVGGSSSGGSSFDGYVLTESSGFLNCSASYDLTLDGTSDYIVQISARQNDSCGGSPGFGAHVMPIYRKFKIDSSDGTVTEDNDVWSGYIMYSYDSATNKLTISTASYCQILSTDIYKEASVGGSSSSGGGVADGSGVSNFTGLLDTPDDLGSAGQFLKVNDSRTALEFTDATAGGGGGFILDGPTSATYAGGIELISNTGQNLFKRIAQGSNIRFSHTTKGITISADYPVATSNFKGLIDTPDNYIAGQILKVNSAGTAIIYEDFKFEQPVGSGFAKHSPIIAQDSFAQDMPDHIYLKNPAGTNVQAFSFSQYSSGSHIEYAPSRTTDFGSYIQFNDDAEGSYKASDISQNSYNAMSLSGFIASGKHHHEAARNTGVYNQGFRSILGAGGAEIIADLSFEPQLQNIEGANRNWTQLQFPFAGARQCSWTVPPSLTQNYLDGKIQLEIAWSSETIVGDVVWEVMLEAYAIGESIDSSKSTSFRQITSTVGGIANSLKYERLEFLPVAAEISANSLLHITVKRNALHGDDTMNGFANLLYLSAIELI